MIKKQLQSVVFSKKKKKHKKNPQSNERVHLPFNSRSELPFIKGEKPLLVLDGETPSLEGESPLFHDADPFRKVPFLSGYALKTGIHVGHKSLRLSKTNFWHPLMSQYFLGIRNGLSLLNPILTRKSLLRAFYMIALVLKTKSRKSKNSNLFFDLNSNLDSKLEKSKKERKGHVLIVNTNPEFSRLCKNLSVLTLHNKKENFLLDINTSSLSYVHYKWVGGTLTNWKQVSKSVLTYAKFAERCEKFLYNNNIDFPRYKKIKECFHGLIRKKQGKISLAFHEKPDLVFLMNPNENKHIIAEANKMHVPVIALVESNSCLKGISYPIPANAYSAFFIYYCLKKMIKLSTF